MSEQVLVWLAQVSWKASLVVLLALVITRLLRGLLPPGLRYALWIVVLARLLLPVAPPSPWSLFHWTDTPLQLEGSLPGLNEPASTSPATAAGIGRPGPGFLPGLDQALLLAWLTGIAVLGGRAAGARWRLRRILVRGRALDDPPLQRLIDDCRRQLGLRRPVQALVTDAVTSPAACCLGRSRLLLPVGLLERLDSNELRHVVLHELVHLRRRDPWIQGLASLARIVHWFNPLARLALRRLEESRELACDARVLALLEPGRRTAYGRTLIRILQDGRRPTAQGSLVALTEHKRQLKKRLDMIARYRPTSPLRSGALLLFVLTFAVGSLTDVPAVGSGGSVRETPEPTAAELEADVLKQKRTIEAIRDAGTAMFNWIVDRWEATPEAARQRSEVETDDASRDWSRCPTISHEKLAALLVPRYIGELPASDGWGHALEFCLDTEQPFKNHYALGVRSAGKDGKLAGPLYRVGAFPAGALERDVVWVDGYFATWPSRGASSEKE